MKSKAFIWRVLFVIYLAALIILVVVKFDGSITTLMQRINYISENRSYGYWNINLKLISSTTRNYLHNIMEMYAFKNIAGNIIPFIPLGFLLPISLPKMNRFIAALFGCFLIILSIECIQFVTMIGYFDVDDILFNLAGSIIGIIIYKLTVHMGLVKLSPTR